MQAWLQKHMSSRRIGANTIHCLQAAHRIMTAILELSRAASAELFRQMRLDPDGMGAFRFAGTGDGDGQLVHSGNIKGAGLGVLLGENGQGLPEQAAVAMDGKNAWRKGSRRAVVIGNLGV